MRNSIRTNENASLQSMSHWHGDTRQPRTRPKRFLHPRSLHDDYGGGHDVRAAGITLRTTPFDPKISTKSKNDVFVVVPHQMNQEETHTRTLSSNYQEPQSHLLSVEHSGRNCTSGLGALDTIHLNRRGSRERTSRRHPTCSPNMDSSPGPG